jgi:hypothetical protein
MLLLIKRVTKVTEDEKKREIMMSETFIMLTYMYVSIDRKEVMQNSDRRCDLA